MYTNGSSSDLLTLESLGLFVVGIYPAFFFGVLTYVLIMSFNLMLVLTIALTKKLHRPMFILLINLPISDMTGATALFPQLLSNILTQSRQISYSACMAQAFLVHFYGTGNLLILTAMAYDRYVAICCPLSYNSIMTPQRVAAVIFTVWMLSFSIIGTLFFLLVRFQFCRTNVVDLYCNNPSLVKMVCEDTRANNIYGIIFIFLLQGGTAILVVYSYVQILRTCFIKGNTNARRKAFQTCGSHLVVFLILQINTLVTLISHRLQNISPYMRRLLGLSVVVFPPLLDPIIYGLKTKELKEGLQMLIKRRFRM